LVSSGTKANDAFTAQLSGANGSILCAHGYGDAAIDNNNQIVTAVTVATAATGSLADSVVMGGSFQGTMTLGSTTLLSTGTPSSFVTGLSP